MANAYSSLHSLTLAICVLSAVGVSLWGRWAMFQLRKLDNGSQPARALMTKIGFAFRCLAYVPLLGVLVFVPPFRCAGSACQPSDIATSTLTASLVLGLLAAVFWVRFVFSRVYGSRAAKLFAEPSSSERTILAMTIALALAALVAMLLGQPAEPIAIGVV